VLGSLKLIFITMLIVMMIILATMTRTFDSRSPLKYRILSYWNSEGQRILQ
jgi:hypothetical protein